MKVRIKDIADIQIGYQFRKGFDPNPFGEYLVIQVRDIDEQNSHRLSAGGLACTNLDRDPTRYLVRNGDVLFLSKGRRNSATMVENLPDDHEAIAAGYFFILRLDVTRLRPDFLAWSINGPRCQAYLNSEAQGSGMPFIPKDAFTSMKIDLPDLNTQHKVVKLHDLATQESRLLEQFQQKRNELIQGICTNAVRTIGRLTKE